MEECSSRIVFDLFRENLDGWTLKLYVLSLISDWVYRDRDEFDISGRDGKWLLDILEDWVSFLYFLGTRPCLNSITRWPKLLVDFRTAGKVGGALRGRRGGERKAAGGSNLSLDNSAFFCNSSSLCSPKNFSVLSPTTVNTYYSYVWPSTLTLEWARFCMYHHTIQTLCNIPSISKWKVVQCKYENHLMSLLLCEPHIWVLSGHKKWYKLWLWPLLSQFLFPWGAPHQPGTIHKGRPPKIRHFSPDPPTP